MNLVLLRFLGRRHGVTVPLCALAPLVIGTLIGFIYPTYSRERETLGPLVKSLKAMFRTDVTMIDIFSPSGAFNIPFQHPITFLSLAVAAAIPALGLPAGERGRGALQLLMATPLSRRALVGTLAVFLLPIAVLMGLAPLLGCVAGASISGVLDEIPLHVYAVTSLNAAAVTAFLGSFALLVSVVSRDRSVATIRYVLGMAWFFLADLGSRLWKYGDWPSYLTPLGYYNPTRILAGESGSSIEYGSSGGFDWTMDVALLLAAAAACVAAAVVTEDRRRSV